MKKDGSLSYVFNKQFSSFFVSFYRAPTFIVNVNPTKKLEKKTGNKLKRRKKGKKAETGLGESDSV